MQAFAPKRAGLVALIGAAALGQASLIPLKSLAQAPYRLNGVAAPQVRPNPLTAQLEGELKAIKQQLEARSQRTSLNQALEAGLLHNPQLAAAYAQIQGQQWNLIAVRRQWYPSLSANSGNSSYLLGQSASTTSSGGAGTTNTTAYNNATGAGVGLSLNWTFFDPSRGPSINAASETLRQQQLLFDVSARNLVLSIQQAYFNLQEQLLLIQSYDQILASTNRQVRFSEAQFNNGLASIADVEQIRTSQFSTLTTVINAYRQLLDTSAQLAQAMALAPGTLVLPSEDLSELGRWDEPLQATIDQALRLREEIQASLAASASASWRATALFNSYWPQFNLGASGGYASNASSSGFPGAGSSSSRSLSWNGGVGIGFSWQLFDGGINAANAEAQRAAARQAQDDAAERRLSVSREVEQSFANYRTSALALQSTKAQADSARAATIAVQERFAVGVTDMASVVQTLNLAIGAANAYAAAVRTYNSAVAALYRSSARWPEGTQPLLEQRVNTLRAR
jgi:outer membrane protein TolC